MNYKDYYSNDIDTAAHLAAEDDPEDYPTISELSEDIRPFYSPETMELVNRVIRLRQREDERRLERGRQDRP